MYIQLPLYKYIHTHINFQKHSENAGQLAWICYTRGNFSFNGIFFFVPPHHHNSHLLYKFIIKSDASGVLFFLCASLYIFFQFRFVGLCYYIYVIYTYKCNQNYPNVNNIVSIKRCMCVCCDVWPLLDNQWAGNVVVTRWTMRFYGNTLRTLV